MQLGTCVANIDVLTGVRKQRSRPYPFAQLHHLPAAFPHEVVVDVDPGEPGVPLAGLVAGADCDHLQQRIDVCCS